jgi:hypothetical protein
LVYNANYAVIATFNILYNLVTDNKDTQFLLRFAYIQLAKAINAFVKVAFVDWCTSYVYKGASYKDKSVYINVYLIAKRKPLNNLRLRNELSERKHIS